MDENPKGGISDCTCTYSKCMSMYSKCMSMYLRVCV